MLSLALLYISYLFAKKNTRIWECCLTAFSILTTLSVVEGCVDGYVGSSGRLLEIDVECVVVVVVVEGCEDRGGGDV